MVARLSPHPIPGPRPLPLVGWRGNALLYARDPLGRLTSLHRAYGDLVALAAGGNGNLTSAVPGCRGTVFVFGPEHHRTILTNTALFPISTRTGLEKSQWARLGSGIFNKNGEPHRRQRRLLLPAFHRDRMAAYHRDMVALTMHALEAWRPGRRDLAQDMHRLTLDIACRALFGLNGGRESDDLGGLLQTALRLARAPAVLLAPLDLPFTPYRRYLRVARRVDEALSGLIARRRTEGAGGGDVLSAMVRAVDADGGLTEDELVGQANALFLAAHETSASALTWAVFLLAQHPAVLADLLDELQTTFGGDGIAPERLEELPLLDRVVRESLRLFPPVPILTRVTAADTVLGRCQLPAATELHLSIYHTHHAEKLYPQAQRFLPDRWKTAAPSPYEYLPFGVGSRLCVGAGFALLEIKTVLALLLRRWRIQIVPGARIDRRVGVTLAMRRGLPVIVAPPVGPPPQRTALRGDVHEIVDLT
ncbi:MAG TPA: cytochrome P450 [Gemmataceae bacterium]|nr:cytochrome P450 [Gemmataceae bacterium]